MVDLCDGETLQGGPAHTAEWIASLVTILQHARLESESDRTAARLSISRLATLLDQASPPVQPAPNLKGGLTPWQIHRLQAFIDGRIDEALPVAVLSRVVGLSSTHFARTFKASFHETPHNFVLRRRVARACGLLADSTLPLHAVAAECGFSDQAHLCKIFKKSVGKTPAAWRRQLQHGDEAADA